MGTRGKGKARQKKREKFKSVHPEGRKAFAKAKRRARLERSYN